MTPMIDRADAFTAWELAPTLCDREHGCTDYHRVWGLLRWLMPSEGVFGGQSIASVVQSISRQGACVLLCGAADTAVLSIILDAIDDMVYAPQVVVVERCATACEVLRRFAHRRGAALTIIQADLTAWSPALNELASRVDVIVAHNILGLIPGEFREAVCSQLADLATGSGLLLTVQTIFSSSKAWSTRAVEGREEQLTRLKFALIERGISEPATHEILEVAQRFWTVNWRQSPVLTRPVLESLLEEAGFRVESIEIDSEVARGPSSLTAKAESERLRLLFKARRL